MDCSENGAAGARRCSALNASAVGAMGTGHGTRCGRRAHGPRGVRNVRASWMYTTHQTFAQRAASVVRDSLAVAFDRESGGRCQVLARRTGVAGRVREPQSCPLVARSLKPAAHSTTVCATTTPTSDGMLVARCHGGARRSASMGMNAWREWRESPRRDESKLRSSAPHRQAQPWCRSKRVGTVAS